VLSRLKAVYEAAADEVELWNKSAAAQLDGQLRERRKTFARRIEAVHRIQQAAGGLDERIAELRQQLEELAQDREALERLSREGVAVTEPAEAPAAAVDTRADTEMATDGER